MIISRTVKISQEVGSGNWKSQEFSVELSHEDLCLEPVKGKARELADLLYYEAEVMLVKTVSSAGYGDCVEDWKRKLLERKERIENVRAAFGK